MAAAAATGNKNLYECPTNVKEALDWLEALASNTDGCAYAITQIVAGLDDHENKVKGVCEAAENFLNKIAKTGGTYQSAYKDATWSQLCKASGGKCCASGGQGGCNDCSNPSNCYGCCAKCPKQICARIFCLIVPIIFRVLSYTYNNCNNNNKRNQNQDDDKWTGKIKDNGIGAFFTACGFDKEKDLKDSTEVSAILDSLCQLVRSLTAMYEAFEKALQSAQQNPQQHFLNGASNQAAKKPSSLTDLLLWLQFLPYCSKYHDVLEEVKEKLNGNQGSNGKQFHERLPMAISHLPMLFLQIEGPGTQRNNGSKQTSSLFLKISELSKCQYIFDQKYYDTNNVVKILLCVFPVIHWGLTAVTQRCSESNCSSTLTTCTETNKLLTSLGWNGSRDSNDASDLKPIIDDKTKCKDLKTYLGTLISGGGAIAKMKDILEGAWQKENGPKGFDTQGQYLPRTIYEMLIWLMGLPVSDKFKELKTQGGVSTVMPEFTKILFQVPHLFLTLNGDLSGMLSNMFQCHGIPEPSKAYQYGNDGSDCLKIFSAIVAILFPVIRYLQQRCNGNGQAFVNGESWSGKKTNEEPLRDFLKFMGFGPTIANSDKNGQTFHSDVLKKIFGDVTQNGGNDKLGKLYECAIEQLKKNSTGGSHTPSTIRQMMLWLIGLPVTTQYGNGSSSGQFVQHVQQQATGINGLSSKITGTGHDSLETNLSHSIVGMMTVISQIEGGLGSVLEFLKEGFKDTNGGSQNKFKYGDNAELFKDFTTCVTSVHVQLRFLYVMCKTQKDKGGWQECKYGNGSGDCGCNGNVASCLKLFLQNGNNNGGGNGNAFKLCQNGESKQTECLQMGFKAYSPQSASIIGDNISTYLEPLLEDIPKTQSNTVEFKKPLSLLTQYCVAIGKIDPSSLGDHFDVFRELASDGMWKKIEKEMKDSLAKIRTDDDTGTTAGNALQGALQAVFPSDHSNVTDHRTDLKSLTGCNGGTCSPFVASLSHGLYRYFDPTKLGTPPKIIDWLYMKMSALYGKLKKLKDEMKEQCQCCPESNPSSKCNGITNCPNCLPLMYKMGLVFGDPMTIVTKSCSELMGVMEKVLEAMSSKLCVVFKSIDENRFWPYLLFASHVVKGKNGQLSGDAYMKYYTHKLKDMYGTYLKGKKGEWDKTAGDNKTKRQGALKCACTKHEYTELKVTPKNPITVTLTLYFQGAYITKAMTITAPFHGPSTNPLVRLYPRNLKSIVDWLLRIGQTRLEQDGSGVEEVIQTFMPVVKVCLKKEDKEAFQQLVTNVMKLMGLENQGKTDVGREVQKALSDVKDTKIKEKIDKHQDTFESILQFKPKDYIDKVIDDFGNQVYDVNGSSDTKRSFECIAKSVSQCMNKALETIKDLAKKNRELESKYNVNDMPNVDGSITDVENLKSISDLKQLCQGFQSFHTVYTTVTGAFNSHLKTAQNGEPWTNINKCVEAFKELGGCVTMLTELSSYGDASKMQDASTKLDDISKKLNRVIGQLTDESLSTFSDKVKAYIDALDKELKEKGVEALAEALKINNGSSTQFNKLLNYYVSELITKMKSNSIGSDKNNTSVDIHLRVRNDLQQLSECLKVMCEVCSTGMKDFADKLKECVLKGKDHLDGIKKTAFSLELVYLGLERFNKGFTQNSEMTDYVKSAITVTHSLLSNKYIYNPPIIVNTLIDTNAVKNMTTYLKSLPDLIRDRYVLQKWHDDAKAFCGVQRFENGIVKKSDITGITGVLKELLKDTFHTTPANDIAIHEFQVKSLIYNFCHKEAMENIIAGLEAISGVKKVLENGDVEWTNIKDKKEKLLPLLTKLSDNAYLRYFASHLRDSVGYHTLSNTLGALDEVRKKLEENNGSSEPEQWDNFKHLLQQNTMTELHQRLQGLLDKLYKEYIFEYPPFDWQKSCKRLVDKQTRARVARAAPAPAASSTTAPTTCEMCVADMSRIFVGFVPQMYRLFKMLRDMTKENGYGRTHKLEYDNNGRDETTTTMSSLAGILSREGWRVKLGSDDDEAFDLDASKTGNEIYSKIDAIITDTPTGDLLAKEDNKDAASTANASLMPLESLFKAVMQHFRKVRDEKRQKRIEKLKTAFDAEQQRTKSGLKFQAPLPALPSTVRQVLFWLHELDTNKAFYDGFRDHINTLCQAASPTVTDHVKRETILHVLKLSITQCLEVLATIEDPGRQNADYYYELYTEEHYYAYPDANIPLFFYTFVEKLMAAFLELNFVCVQCEFRALEGGWRDCEIGKAHKGAYEVQGSVCCICHERKTVGTPLHRVNVSGSVVCPRPLSAFLFSDQKNQLRIPSDVSQRSAYMSKGTMPCGFQLKNKAITDPATPSDASTPTPTPTSMTGSVLVEPLRKLVGGHVTGRLNDTQHSTLRQVIYLRDLLRYVLCLAVRPPWSMSENMAFFYRVTESWKQKGGGSVRVAHQNNELLQSIHAEIALFPGTFEASLLTSAVERFAGIEDNNKHKTSVPAQSNTSHQYDLRTLMGCQELNTSGTSATGTTPAQCSPFMFPLALDVYTHYDERNSRAYLSWILNFAFGIYGQLKALEEMIKESACVMKNASQCPSLPMCPGVLTALYQSGSSFMDQKQLAKKDNAQQSSTTTTRKTCSDFHTVLTGLFNCDSTHCSPLHNLIVQCEAFLWSIRMPFSLVQLSLWSVAILFISYVFVVPLDHFKIKSHLFNRLKYTMHPSLLIADQQRRVSEVAYFSL